MSAEPDRPSGTTFCPSPGWHTARDPPDIIKGVHTVASSRYAHLLPFPAPCTTHALPMHYPCTTHALPMHYPCISQYTRSWTHWRWPQAVGGGGGCRCSQVTHRLSPESASPRIRIPPKRRLADNPQDNPAALASTLRRRLLHFDKSCLKISECMEPAKRCDSSINGADDRDFLRWEGCHFPFSLTLLSCHFDQSKRSGQM